MSFKVNNFFCNFSIISINSGFISFTEYTNMFFIALFTMEMLLKMYSLGFQVSYSFNEHYNLLLH